LNRSKDLAGTGDFGRVQSRLAQCATAGKKGR
jgi:hypothetical protein